MRCACRFVKDRSTMLSIVAADRIVGAWSLALVAGICSLVLIGGDTPTWVLPIAPCILVFATMLWLALIFPNTHLVHRLLESLHAPDAIRLRFDTVMKTGKAFAGQKQKLAMIAVAACVQCSMIAMCVGVLSLALRLPASMLDVSLIFPVVALITMAAPLTISGHGLREQLFLALVMPLGPDQNQALALACAWLTMIVIRGVPGIAGWAMISK